MIPSMTVAESSTCARDLFGGAIVCNIPESYEDISIYRTVSFTYQMTSHDPMTL